MDELLGKTVAITGCTGGLGREICPFVLSQGGRLIMIDRNPEKQAALISMLRAAYPGSDIRRLTADMTSPDSVAAVSEELALLSPDILVLNAGAYAIPRCDCNDGHDNIFRINFLSPYYIARRLTEVLPSLKVVCVGSLSHALAKYDASDPEYRSRRSAMCVYGNAKRMLTVSMHCLFKGRGGFALVHPGICGTDITSSYPRVIRAIIKYPMRLLFHSPSKAARSICAGIKEDTEFGRQIGPRILGIRGRPKVYELKACFGFDLQSISGAADLYYDEMKKYNIHREKQK